MSRQHTENLFRRYKAKLVNIKTLSGSVYTGHVAELTNDYVALTDGETDDLSFVFFSSIESVQVVEVPTPT